MSHSTRLHPGWACFFLAYLCGMMTMAAVVYFVVHPNDWGVAFYVVGAVVLFWAGGSKAERLYDRQY